MSDPKENDAPAEHTPDADAEAGLAQAAPASPDATPDAVKAMPIDTGGETANTPAGLAAMPGTPSLGGIPINEPSMDFAQAIPMLNGMTEAHRAEFPRFGDSASSGKPRNMDLLLDVKLPVAIELGRTTLPISEILEWAQGSVIELDKLAGEPVDLLVNNKLVARGEVVVIDEKFGLRITALISAPDTPQPA